MTDYQDESEEYKEVLNKALYILCEAMGVDQEKYDTDQVDTECYMDCFREAAKLLKRAGYKYDDETGEFINNE